MKLVCLGDICTSSPLNISGQSVPAIQPVDYVLANLEGMIVRPTVAADRSASASLYNTLDVLNALQAFQVRAAWLANNHIGDLPMAIRETIEILKQANIAGFGAGVDLAAASRPLVLHQDGTIVKAFAFGWDVIGCRPATKGGEGVNPFTPQHVLRTIRNLRVVDTSSFVLFIMHWNYELESYPQPAHRQLAHDLIRGGVDAVIGLHPHVAQGAEMIEGKPVIYSLGNWFFPVRQVGHLLLKYPPVSARELAVEFEIEGRQVNGIRFHWHQFDAEQCLIHFEKTEGWDGPILQKLTPFAGMSHPEYVRWFRANRTRRLGLPVYGDYHHIWRNRVKDRYVKLRQKFIEMLVRWHFKNGLS